MKRARKRDANEKEIVEALQLAGAVVQRLDAKGVPDLLVGYAGRTLLLEVKMPLGPKGGVHAGGNHVRGDLTADQVDWFDAWRGQLAVVRSAAEALRAIGAAS